MRLETYEIDGGEPHDLSGSFFIIALGRPVVTRISQQQLNAIVSDKDLRWSYAQIMQPHDFRLDDRFAQLIKDIYHFQDRKGPCSLDHHPSGDGFATVDVIDNYVAVIVVKQHIGDTQKARVIKVGCERHFRQQLLFDPSRYDDANSLYGQQPLAVFSAIDLEEIADSNPVDDSDLGPVLEKSRYFLRYWRGTRSSGRL